MSLQHVKTCGVDQGRYRSVFNIVSFHNSMVRNGVRRPRTRAPANIKPPPPAQGNAGRTHGGSHDAIAAAEFVADCQGDDKYDAPAQSPSAGSSSSSSSCIGIRRGCVSCRGSADFVRTFNHIEWLTSAPNLKLRGDIDVVDQRMHFDSFCGFGFGFREVVTLCAWQNEECR